MAKCFTNAAVFHRINREARLRRTRFFVLLDNSSSHVLAAKILNPTGSVETFFMFEKYDGDFVLSAERH
jgi:hypothetical protein